MTPGGAPSPSTVPGTDTDLELHANIQSLQAEVRALAAAIEALCRAVETGVDDLDDVPEAVEALEQARLSLGKIW